MSLRDLPFLYDIRGGSLNISFSNGCSSIKCQCFMSICFYVVQMLNTQLEFPCEVAPFFRGHGWFIPL